MVSTWSPPRYTIIIGGAAVAVSLLTAAALTWMPVLAMLPLGLASGLWLASSSRLRAAFIVLGGVLVLQSSSALTVSKLAYFLGVAVCVVIAVTQSSDRRELRRAMAPTAVLAAFVVLSLGTALSHGTDLASWTRGALPYLLLTASPLLATDLRSGGARYLTSLFLTAGAVSVCAFTAEWSARRGLDLLPVAHFALSSFSFASAVFIYACAKLMLGSGRRVVWIAVACLVATSFLLTGTRASVALFVAPFVMALAPTARQARGPMRALTTIVAIIVAISLALVASSASGGPPIVEKATARLSSFLPDHREAGAEASLRARRVVGEAAWDTFKTAPVMGVGLGHVWTYPLPYATAGGYGLQFESATIDSPLEVPAELGLFGTAAALWLFIAAFRLSWSKLPGPPGLTLVGLLTLTAVYGITTNALADKGLAFAVTLLLAISLTKSSEEAAAGMNSPETSTRSSIR